MTEPFDRAAIEAREQLRDFLDRPEVADSWAAGVVRSVLADLEEAEREVAKITENRNEWASRMMELATTEQKLERAERRIAAVVAEADAIRAAFIEFWGAHSSADIERVGRSPRMPRTPALDRERTALHPVAETK